MRGRVLRAVSLAAALALLTAGVALADAGGQGTVTETQQFRNVTFFHDVTNPCTGQSGTLTATAKTGIFHVTTTGLHTSVTGTDQGTATFTPDDPTGVSASGHYAEHFGASFNNKNAVERLTSTFNMTGSDGSHIVARETSHIGINANGVIIVSFDNVDMHCG